MKTKFFALIMSVCLVLCGCSAELNNDSENRNNEIYDDEEIRAVWINYYELNEIINSSKNADELRNNIENVIKNCKNFGLNRIFLHVRAYADAYYCSEIFSIADSLENKIKIDKNFDPLKLFCETAHKYGIKIDAWINPYRISYSSDSDKLKSTLIKEMLENNSMEICVIEKGIFFNPASQKVQSLIINGVREILKNYKVDGIHIDDYFYPVTDESFDEKSYSIYKKNGGKLELLSWRTENVNSLISQLYSTVKAFDDKLIFSISPSANIDLNVNEYCADVNLWCGQRGYADYIIPQIYFGFENENLPFEKVVGEWEKLINTDEVKLCFGLACYKIGKEDEYAGTGRNEWIKNSNIIARQICYVRESESYSGFSLYSYSSLFDRENVEKNKNELQNIESVI